MAFVGTLFAALLALSLGVLAARAMVRDTLVKRAFDFLRSVDMLVWALLFTSAFGLGPLAGIVATFPRAAACGAARLPGR